MSKVKKKLTKPIFEYLKGNEDDGEEAKFLLVHIPVKFEDHSRANETKSIKYDVEDPFAQRYFLFLSFCFDDERN